MYGSLKSNGVCQQTLLDPDHICTEDCQEDLVETSVKKKHGSVKSSIASMDTQRLLPASEMSGSRAGYVDLESSGKQGSGSRTSLLHSRHSSVSSTNGSAVGINVNYQDFSREPGFSIIDNDVTGQAIRLCEKYLLCPYKFSLRMIGWLPFGHSRCAMVAQVFMVLIWTLAILVAMTTQILTCFKRDVFILHASMIIIPASNNISEIPLVGPYHQGPQTCSHKIISFLILPDIVLLLAYFFGVYLFSRGETEYLYRLASHVFIKNSESNHVSYNKRLYGSIIVFAAAGVIWLLYSLGIRIMSAFASDLFDLDRTVKWPPDVEISGGLRVFLVIFSLFGFFSFDLVYLFAVINYAAQAEMNVYLLKDIATLIRNKKYEHIDDAIKDIHECHHYIGVLSRRTATLTALALFDLSTLAFNGLTDLPKVSAIINHPHHHFDQRALSSVAAGLNCVCWVILIIFPFVQAARVTHAAELLKDVGPEVRARPLQYKKTSLLDLDSILNYLQTTKLHASIFGVPIRPWMAYTALVSFTFTLLVLFQHHKFDSLTRII